MNPLLSSHIQLHSQGQLHAPSVKKELQEANFRPEIPSWLAYPPVGEASHGGAHNPTFSSPPPSSLSTHLDQSSVHRENPNPTMLPPSFQPIASHSHHMSATALLQKASQIGATMSRTTSSLAVLKPYLHTHVPESTTGYSTLSMATSSAVSGLAMPSREEIGTGPFAHGLASYGNKAGITSEYLEEGATATNTGDETPLIHDMMDGTVTTSVSPFEEALRGMMNPTRGNNNFQELVSKSAESQGAGVNDETRDFLGLGVFSQRDFFNIPGLDHLGSSSYCKQNQNQPPWQG